jgi:glutamate-ammonia-ligase adenylyltransferase
MMAMKKDPVRRWSKGKDNIEAGRGESEIGFCPLQLVCREPASGRIPASIGSRSPITEEDCLALSEAYRFLRTVEHRIQVVQERQTHNLPAKEEEIRVLARRCGFLRENGLARFREVLEGHRQKVSAIYGDLFLSGTKSQEISPKLYLPGSPSDSD